MKTDIEVFQDPGSSDEALLRCIGRIPPGGAPASLWSGVANDPACRPFHRSLAVYELMRRHLPRPATLAQAALLFAGAAWLAAASIEKIEVMGGEIPVAIPEGGAAFVLRLPREPSAAHPDLGAYLALDQDLDAAALRRGLELGAADPGLAGVTIRDFALFPERLGE